MLASGRCDEFQRLIFKTLMIAFGMLKLWLSFLMREQRGSEQRAGGREIKNSCEGAIKVLPSHPACSLHMVHGTPSLCCLSHTLAVIIQYN